MIDMNQVSADGKVGEKNSSQTKWLLFRKSIKR